MVSKDQVAVSNGQIPSQLPANLVAVFVGGTSGLGEAALKAFTKRAVSPRLYIVGRSQERATRIIEECKSLNPNGEYAFLQADLDLMVNVDGVCEKIKEREKVINLLCLSQGGADKIMNRTATSEGLNSFFSTNFYSRTLFAQNLLPLVKAAASVTAKASSHARLARIVTIAGGTKEGSMNLDDIAAWKIPVYAIRDHVSTMTTFTLEQLRVQAPEVSFVHYYPGFVQTRLFDTMPGLLGMTARTMAKLVGPFVAIPVEESGEMMLFVSTSARYDPGGVDHQGSRVNRTTEEGEKGEYSLDEYGEPAGPKILKLLQGYRVDGSDKKVWGHFEVEMKRIRETSKS